MTDQLSMLSQAISKASISITFLQASEAGHTPSDSQDGETTAPFAPIDADNTQEARVMRLKGYGNAIVPQVAAQFIKAFMKYSDLDDLC